MADHVKITLQEIPYGVVVLQACFSLPSQGEQAKDSSPIAYGVPEMASGQLFGPLGSATLGVRVDELPAT